MALLPAITFSNIKLPTSGNIVVLCDKSGKFSTTLGNKISRVLSDLMNIADFSADKLKCLELLKPHGTGFDRVVIVGLGNAEELGENDWLKLGGKVFKAVKNYGTTAILLEHSSGDISAAFAADFAMGAKLASYRFDAYKTKEDNNKKAASLKICTSHAPAARKLWKNASAVADGVLLARDLVNQPANVLTPTEFAKRAKALTRLGVDVEILDEKQMKKLKMQALLGVARGSEFPAYLAVMQWRGGAKKKEAPIAFVGKGVTFDTGGVSMKPPAGMEDMKGDMGGAAAVTGLMHALAARKARVNVVGIIGLVENAVDAKAQRPGDIVGSMSGQTIEILNTDAEGRLVLADALWYCQHRFKPKFMVNLATLTGAILVALGHHHAGLFSNNDQLAQRLLDAGLSTDEKLWRMPLDEAYDKLLDSKNADMKNIGGRMAGAITAAQFLQKFVNKVPWAHLDVAGTAMASPKTEINQSWASGFGVRLLDRLVKDNYEG